MILKLIIEMVLIFDVVLVIVFCMEVVLILILIIQQSYLSSAMPTIMEQQSSFNCFTNFRIYRYLLCSSIISHLNPNATHCGCNDHIYRPICPIIHTSTVANVRIWICPVFILKLPCIRSSD